MNNGEANLNLTQKWAALNPGRGYVIWAMHCIDDAEGIATAIRKLSMDCDANNIEEVGNSAIWDFFEVPNEPGKKLLFALIDEKFK